MNLDHAVREGYIDISTPEALRACALAGGQRVRYAGIVINRQRPGTAKGVVFMTLEDETGFVNVVVWQSVFEKYQVIAKTASFLGVTGKAQSEAGVTHVIAATFWTPTSTPRRAHKRVGTFTNAAKALAWPDGTANERTAGVRGGLFGIGVEAYEEGAAPG